MIGEWKFPLHLYSQPAQLPIVAFGSLVGWESPETAACSCSHDPDIHPRGEVVIYTYIVWEMVKKNPEGLL